MVVLGGIADPGNITQTKCWQLEDEVWTVVEKCSIPVESRWFSACIVGDGVVVSGGLVGDKSARQCWLLATADNQWSPLPDLNTARLRHASVYADGQMYVLGGDKGNLAALFSRECFNTTATRRAAKWEILPDMPKALYHLIAVLASMDQCFWWKDYQ